MTRRAAVLPRGLCTVFLLAGCVTGSYDRATLDQPLLGARLEALRPGPDDLAS